MPGIPVFSGVTFMVLQVQMAKSSRRLAVVSSETSSLPENTTRMVNKMYVLDMSDALHTLYWTSATFR